MPYKEDKLGRYVTKAYAEANKDTTHWHEPDNDDEEAYAEGWAACRESAVAALVEAGVGDEAALEAILDAALIGPEEVDADA